MRRSSALFFSFLFLILAPGTVAGLGPWWINGWRFHDAAPALRGLGFLLIAGGLYLLHSIAGESWNGIPVWVDAIVTGIVVGSGTKPLHDVISRVQKNKEKSEDTP